MNRTPRILALLLCLVSTFTFVGAAQPATDPHSAGLEALVAGDNQKAINLFSLAIAANPDDFRSYNDRGVAYKMASDFEKAAADYTRAIEIKPDYFNAWNNRGVLHLQQGRFDSAIKDFQEALKSEELKSKVYTNLGIAYAKKGNHHEAVEFLGAATAARPLDPRSFVFIAESLEQLGQNERALSMYQLALGLLRDTAITQLIEKRVDRLEKGAVDSRVSRTATPSAEEQLKRGSDKRATRDQQPAAKTGEARIILPARSAPATPASKEQKTVHARGETADTLEALDQFCRSRALEKMSPASVEIYQQGLQFLDRSDTRQALIRFEDILQLERRKKNPAAVAWSTFEIARTYLKIGDHVAADAKFQEALKFFRHLKAAQETILCLTEIAASRKAVGQADKGASFYAQAVEQATTLGNERLVRDIQDHASGKMVRREKPLARIASSAATETADPRKSASGQKAGATGRLTPTTPSVSPKAESIEKPGRKHLAWGDSGKTTGSLAAAQPVTREGAAATSATQQEPSARKPDRTILQASGPKVSEKPLAVETKVGGDRVVAVGSPPPRQESFETSKGRSDRRSAEPSARGRFSERNVQQEALIRERLAELRKYRDARDEGNTVIVLEKLSEAYLHQRQYDKALHCLVASLAFREKLGLNKGIEKLYETRGSIRESLGDYAAAIEDLSRALVLSQDRGSAGVSKNLGERVRKLAHALGLDSAAAAQAYQSLWKARAREDARGETQALYLIGRLYDQADKLEQALSYYERTAASMLNDKARIYEKIGKKNLAEQSYRSTLESFRQLDYSRYLALLKKSKAGGLSRR